MSPILLPSFQRPTTFLNLYQYPSLACSTLIDSHHASVYQTYSSTSGCALVFSYELPYNQSANLSVWKGQICVLRTVSNFIPAGNPKLVIAISGIGHLLGHSTNHEAPFACLSRACHLAQLLLHLVCCSFQLTSHHLSRSGSLIMNPHQKNKVDISVSDNLPAPGQGKRNCWQLLTVRAVS